MKKSGLQQIDLELARRRFLLLLLVDARQRRAGLPDPEGLDLNLPLRRAPAGAGLALRLDRDLLGRKTEPRAGDGIVDHAPADLRLLRLGRGGQQGALLRVEHAGFLELAIALERLDGGGRLVVGFAVDQAVVVAGPGEVELDGDAIGERLGGIARWSRRRRRAFLSCRRRGRANGAFAGRRRGIGRLGGDVRPPRGGMGAQGRRPHRGLAEFGRSARPAWSRRPAARRVVGLGGDRKRAENKDKNGAREPHGTSLRCQLRPPGASLAHRRVSAKCRPIQRIASRVRQEIGRIPLGFGRGEVDK